MIKPANHTHIPTIQQIAYATWPTTYGGIISEAQITYMLELMYSETSLQQQMAKGHQFYLAEVNGQAVGFASISQEENTVYKLNKLYVLPTTQKTGSGKALLQQAKQYTIEQAGTQLILQVNKHNNAKEFYLRQGFIIVKEIVLELDHGYIMDDYIMSCGLD